MERSERQWRKPPKASEPSKADEGKKSAAPPKVTVAPKPPVADPGKPGEDKKLTEPPKAATDSKPPAAAAAPGKSGEDKKPTEPPKATTDPKAPTAATPGKSAESKKPAEAPKAATAPKTPSTADPGKPAEDKKPDEPPKAKDTEEEIPKDFKLPVTKEGQSEIITTLKVSEIHPFEGHPFNAKDDKDMMDLVDSVKKFGVLEPVVVIPRKAGGYEMVSGHRRRRACELAGITTMPVIVRQLDRDEAVISMVDANLKRENISPMEKARVYAMKLEAMKHKAGRRTKEEVAAMEAAGKKPMRADEELAQQTGERPRNCSRWWRKRNSLFIPPPTFPT